MTRPRWITPLLVLALASALARAPPDTETRVGSRHRDVYHRLDCYQAGQILEHNLVSWPSEAAAIAAGRRACRTCHRREP